MPGHCLGPCVKLDSRPGCTLIDWDLAGSLAVAVPLPGGINFNHSLRGGGALAGPAEAPHHYALGIAGCVLGRRALSGISTGRPQTLLAIGTPASS